MVTLGSLHAVACVGLVLVACGGESRRGSLSQPDPTDCPAASPEAAGGSPSWVLATSTHPPSGALLSPPALAAIGRLVRGACDDVFVFGSTNGPSQWDDNALAAGDSFLAHLDAFGRADWLRTWSDSSAAVQAAAAAPGGGIAVGGELSGPADFGSGPRIGVDGDLDAFVATYDSKDALLSFAQYGDESAQWVSALATNEFGLSALLATGYGTADFGEGGPTFPGWLVEFDAAGAVDGVVSRFPADTPLVALDAAGRITVAGPLSKPTDFGNGAIGLANDEFTERQQMFIVSYDPAGRLRWSKAFQEAGVAQLLASSNGDILLAGDMSTNAGLDLGCGFTAEGATAFVARLDADGNCRWSQSLSGTLSISIAFDAAGGIVVAGRADAVVGDPDGLLAGASAGVFYVERFSAEGTPLTAQRFGGLQQGQVASLSNIAASETSVWLTGTFAGGLELNGATLETTPTASEAYVARLAF